MPAEDHERWLLPLALPRRGECLVDVGAHHGQFAGYVGARGRRVVCFEPFAESFETLERRTAQLPTVERHRVALWDAPARLRAAHGVDMHVRFEEHESGETLARTLDGFELSNVGTIKLDVEGAEMRVLRGARETIARSMPDLIVETHEALVPGVTAEVRAFVRSFGYHVRMLNETALVSHVLASRRAVRWRWLRAQAALALHDPRALVWRARKAAVGTW